MRQLAVEFRPKCSAFIDCSARWPAAHHPSSGSTTAARCPTKANRPAVDRCRCRLKVTNQSGPPGPVAYGCRAPNRPIRATTRASRGVAKLDRSASSCRKVSRQFILFQTLSPPAADRPLSADTLKENVVIAS